MEDLTFLFTALACGIFTFCTWCHGEIKHAEEKYLIKEIMDSVEIYIATELQHFKQLMVKNQLAKQEHIMQCILFRSVYVIEDIKGMYIEAEQSMTFNDINVIDWNGEKVLVKVEHTYEPRHGLPPRTKINIEFEVCGIFKFIEFIGLELPPNNLHNFRHKANVQFLACNNTAICTTTITNKKNKIYNTAFVCTL